VTHDGFRGPTSFAIDGWTVLAERALPAIFDAYKEHAALVDEFDLQSGEGDVFFSAVGAARPGTSWPTLVVAQRFKPCQAGFDPGVAVVPSTATVFVGAGTRLLGYRLDGQPIRLWEDVAELGFWHWSVHPGAVLMAAELELAAWNLHGVKLWSRFVEPPWDYSVAGDRVTLDVMGAVSEFGLTDAP
jgi:hypothetical protein